MTEGTKATVVDETGKVTITLPGISLAVGDIVDFHTHSFSWMYPHHGPGPDNNGLRGLVVNIMPDGAFQVLLLRWMKGLTEWDNCVGYHPVEGAWGGDYICAADDITWKRADGFRGVPEIANLVAAIATYTKLLGWEFEDIWNELHDYWTDDDGPYSSYDDGGHPTRVIFWASRGSVVVKEAIRTLAAQYTPNLQDTHRTPFACSECGDSHLPLTAPGDSTCVWCADNWEVALWGVHDQPELVWGYLGGSDTDEYHACLRYIFASVIIEAGDELGLSSQIVTDLRERSLDFDLGGWAALRGELRSLEQLRAMTRDALEYVKEEMGEMLLEDEERDREVTPEDMIRTEIQNLRKAVVHAESILHSMEALSGR
jgi:hypothetical protein